MNDSIGNLEDGTEIILEEIEVLRGEKAIIEFFANETKKVVEEKEDANKNENVKEKDKLKSKCSFFSYSCFFSTFHFRGISYYFYFYFRSFERRR